MSVSDQSAAKIQPSPSRRRVGVASALVGALLIGGGATAFAIGHRQPSVTMLPSAPIASMHERGPVAIKGQVAEIFGNKFVVQDESGRALVETGPKGERESMVTKSETVTVQGRFEHGFVHAQVISHVDGRNEYVGPPGPLHDGPHDKPIVPGPKAAPARDADSG